MSDWVKTAVVWGVRKGQQEVERNRGGIAQERLSREGLREALYKNSSTGIASRILVQCASLILIERGMFRESYLHAPSSAGGMAIKRRECQMIGY